MSEPAVLIATAKVRPVSKRFCNLEGAPRYDDRQISRLDQQRSHAPDEHSDAWTIVLNFKSRDLLD